MVAAGKVAVKAASADINILEGQLLNGPYFGDVREKIGDSQPLESVASEFKSTFNVIETKDLQPPVGTTECVWGRLSHRDKSEVIAQIKASYDPVGLDTKNDSEDDEERVDYTGAQTEMGMVLEHDFKAGFVGWSPNLKLEHTDFLKTRRTIAVSAPADLDMKLRLDDKLYGHREVLLGKNQD